jgi:hypothetical protein
MFWYKKATQVFDTERVDTEVEGIQAKAAGGSKTLKRKKPPREEKAAHQ